MSNALLLNLRDYLCGTLSPENLSWLSSELAEYSKRQELEAYTVEELLERAERGRKEIAEGHYKTNEEVLAKIPTSVRWNHY